MPLDPALLAVLGCPDHPDAGLRADDDHGSLTCLECTHAFPVVGGVPVLLPPQPRQ
ncbi:Trm112 family protein [Kitasatospora sp. NBC_00085]|uniref:Trm112 family protein n=1 Tax=unclassified Kitasatospora TaxID=2633591 RepID=UPI002F90EDF8